MADFNLDVDTTPMAHTVDSVRGHVNGVTTAVVAMEAAVIASEREASRNICENVDSGFYMQIRSQISQKSVAAYSEMISKQMLLMQQAKLLESKKKQMENDYNMISKRYGKLFNSLNKALETRIKELDKPAMTIAETKKRLVFDKLKDSSSLLISAADETTVTAQTALGGKLKQKTRNTMHALSGSVLENQSYSGKLQRMLQNKKTMHGGSEDQDFYLLPVIFSTAESFLNKESIKETVYSAHAPFWQNNTPIVTAVTNAQTDFSWTSAGDGERETVKKEFTSLLEKEQLEKRTIDEIMRLFEQTHWEVLEK
ncbi:hypothetical protein AGMMS49944_12740 [Spirochaetia bacterium]|nr:hypothetical protein AGMMS49944_12740 [Spirochaetia bacterium]